jgi:hypothetical protein
VAATSTGHAQDRILTLDDVSPELGRLIGGTPLDFVAAEQIVYGVTGNGEYDDFFRSSAIAYGGFVVGRGLADDATLTLKGYARSKVAVAELEEEIAELTEGADTTDWTTEQSLAVLRAAEMRDQLSDEEREYMVRTAANIAATIPVVEASVSSSTALVAQAPDLVSGARGAFGLRRAPGVVRNVRRSADRISDIPNEGPALVESLVVLSRGLAFVVSGN